MLALKRRLYSLILRLHPAAFRSRFAREMALDFDDALATYGFPRLLADATHSLVRQWMTAPAFTPNAAAAPIPSHPLLAGHYLAIDDDNLKPFEILRGMLIFLVFAFLIGRAFNAHPGRVVPIQPNLSAGHDGGVSIGHFSHTASPANPGHSEAQPDYSQTLAIPTSSLPSGYGMSAHNGHATYVNPAAKVVGPQTESWKEFLTRCALITAIVWLTSLLLRRSRTILMRVALIAVGLLGVTLSAVARPLHFPPTHAQVTPSNTQTKPDLLLFHPVGPPFTYEVATIKPLDPDTAGSMVRLPPGVSSGLSPLSIRRYIMDAYGAIYLAQIVGGPDWLNKDPYQINARPPADLEAAMRNMTIAAANQKRAMQQSLLADRFHLKAHFETRVLPVYELVPAKSGLKITEVPAPPERKGPYTPLIHVSAGALPPGTSVSGTRADGAQEMNARAIPMEMLARYISSDGATELESRPIVDHTGFTGYFDIKDLTWAPLSTTTTEPSSAPFLQRALEDQLGIKLQPAKAPIEVLVIDSIDRPSGN